MYVPIPTLVHEADPSGSLDLYNVDIERYTSVCTLGVTEFIAMENKLTGIIFVLNRKIPLTLNPELPCDTAVAFS